MRWGAITGSLALMGGCPSDDSAMGGTDTDGMTSTSGPTTMNPTASASGSATASSNGTTTMPGTTTAEPTSTTTVDPPTSGSESSTGEPAGPAPECVDTVEAAEAFLESLEMAESDEALFDWTDEHRTQFEFLPVSAEPRTGLNVGGLTEAQNDLFVAFLQAAMSMPGYMKVDEIRQLEDMLGMNPASYFISVFGTPNIEGGEAWGWRFEGHHLSIHNSMLDCERFAATPAFWGASPTLAPIQDEVDGAIALWDALDGTQQGQADMTIGPDAVDQKLGLMAALTPAGVLAGDMDNAQLGLLRDLVAEFVNNMNDAVAADRLAAIEDAGFDDVGFTYDSASGNWRVLGPTFLIEFIYSDPTHVHAIWRDYDGDYGEDLIAAHLHEHPH